MHRRDFITLLGGAAAAWPLAARAQQPTMPVIGYLNSETLTAQAPYMTAFRQGLSGAGYVEGQNLAIEYRWAEGQYNRLPTLAADLVNRHVAVIGVNSETAAKAAKAATSTIPIVFSIGTDPVQAGLVASLNRPGGNLTGISFLFTELGPKRLELLHEIVPTATVIALLVNPNNPLVAESTTKETQAAAGALGLQLRVLHASTEGDIQLALANLAQLRVGGLIIGNDPTLGGLSQQLATLALSQRVPAIYATRQFVEAGGLMSYGANLKDSYRLAGTYVGRVLKGEKAADLPVMQPTKFELVLNLKTAKALGLTVPPTLLVAADDVVE